MTTAVESSALLDVLASTPEAAQLAADSLALCAAQGRLIVCETVIAEVTPEIGANSAVLAGRMHSDYLRHGGKHRRVVPDFLIGAHALTHADRLLTRDAGFSRDYFKGLGLISPTSAKSAP